jgi:hypothetical protein
MRKLLRTTFTLAFALVFTAGLAFGQNNNSATIKQAQSGNQATSNQTGSGGTAFIDQKGVSNIAQIDQAGNGNLARIVGQTGFGNTATSTQDAATRNSQVIIEQKGDGFTKPGVTAQQFGQSGSRINVLARRTGVGGDVDVTQQNGRNNLIDVDLFGNSYVVDVDQVDGSDNKAFVTQNNGTGLIAPTNSEAKVRQEGSRNTTRVTQDGKGHKSVATNNGDGNTLVQKQSGTNQFQRIESDGNRNTFRVTQMGSGNDLYVNGRGTGPGLNTSRGADRNTFTATQDGSDLVASGSIDGTGNRITLDQLGSDNTITGGSGLFSAGGFQVRGDRNTLTIYQDGSSHTATALIDGTGNTETITQMGSNNTASITVQ